MPALRLWGRPTSTKTERVLWALAELAIPFELTLASATMGPDGPARPGHPPYGTVDTPVYRARNPNGTIPTIDESGFTLWDSMAILVYLASKPGPLQLTDPQALATAVQWMSWANEYLEPPLHTLVMELVRLPPAQRNPAAAAAARQDMQTPLAILDAHLASRDFIGGTSFGIADIACGVAYHRWRLFTPDAQPRPHADQWHARLLARPPFQRHVAPAAFHLGGAPA